MTALLLAGPDVAFRAFRDDHDRRHAAWARHERRCRRRCQQGLRCPVGSDLATDADVAGWRLSEAKRRLKRESTPTTAPRAATPRQV